jgi:hypothetical protein
VLVETGGSNILVSRNARDDNIMEDWSVSDPNGENGNPERNTMGMRLKARGTEANYTLHLTCPVDEIDVARRRTVLIPDSGVNRQFTTIRIRGCIGSIGRGNTGTLLRLGLPAAACFRSCIKDSRAMYQND